MTPEGRAEPKGMRATASVALLQGSPDAVVGIPGSNPVLLLAGSCWRDSAFSLWLVKFSSLAYMATGQSLFLVVNFYSALSTLKGGPKAEWRIKILLGSNV